MYLLNAIKKQFNQDDSGSSSGGGGGFLKMLGSFFGGGASGGGGGGEGDFLPLASGGPAYSGMSYLVGERGPELFSPRTSGSITPNGRFGGVTHQHFYDLRGADVGVEQRLLRLFPIVEERAVQRSIATVQERNLRR